MEEIELKKSPQTNCNAQDCIRPSTALTTVNLLAKLKSKLGSITSEDKVKVDTNG